MNMFARVCLSAAALATLSGAADAAVLFSNYTPSDTPVVHVSHRLPLDYRAPDASKSYILALSIARFCSADCSSETRDYASTDFVASTSFTASNLIVPTRLFHGGTGMEVQYRMQKLNAGTGTWESLGVARLQTNLLIGASTVEADLMFGEAGADEAHFQRMPIDFIAGERYRLLASYSGGGPGNLYWYASGQAAAPGQTRIYNLTRPSGDLREYELPWQPAFALTDGSLAGAAVPEPQTWAMMILGLGAAGFGARRRGRHAARA